MTPLFGSTRSVVRSRYALLEPSGFVASTLPGWSGVTAYVVISPAMGAKFTQTHLHLTAESRGTGESGPREIVAWMVRGAAKVKAGLITTKMVAGDYLFIPPHTSWQVMGAAKSEIIWFEKIYQPLPEVAAPAAHLGRTADVPAQPFLGDPAARLQVLLPDGPAFDFGVNVFTYQPGARLPMVETHVMEHGLVMLSGQGVYRLGDEWFPVQAGDVIWMGPYCPQWFVAMGTEPASYLYCKDINRPLL